MIRLTEVFVSRWTKPEVGRERDEFERVADEEGIDVTTLMSAARSAKLEKLDDATWKGLENSDSWETTDISDAGRLAAGYGRDISRIVRGLQNGDEIPAPIVLKRDDGTCTLVAGNTRLMAARVLGVRPTVLMIRA